MTDRSLGVRNPWSLLKDWYLGSGTDLRITIVVQSSDYRSGSGGSVG